MQFFADLKMPFPLFLAPIADAWVDPPGVCNACGGKSLIRFRLACYDCFRAGKADHVLDTELGMVRDEDAQNGWTHGLPLSNPNQLPDYELIPHPIDPAFPDETWYHVRVAADYLFELLRTPSYHTWQGERWLFCCQRPCVFVGSLPSELISREAMSITDSISELLRAPNWASQVRRDSGSHLYYVFRCPICDRIKFHDDND